MKWIADCVCTCTEVTSTTVDTSLLFRSIIAVLSEVVDVQSNSSHTDCILVARDPYQPVWDCVASVYCNTLIGK